MVKKAFYKTYSFLYPHRFESKIGPSPFREKRERARSGLLFPKRQHKANASR